MESVPNRFFQYFVIFLFHIFFIGNLFAQEGLNYEVADWYGFRASAVTYTFDDNTINQFAVAQPLFDRYDYKVTFFVITDRISDWTNCKNAADKGHKITSHTVSHKKLEGQTVVSQENELRNSQDTIKLKVKSNCFTIAYPNCAMSDRATTEKHYIAGRICSHHIVPKAPTDFYKKSAISRGSAYDNVQTSKQFNGKVDEARKSKGWCVFLIQELLEISYDKKNYAHYTFNIELYDKLVNMLAKIKNQKNRMIFVIPILKIKIGPSAALPHTN